MRANPMKRREVTIGAHTYFIAKMPPMEGLEVLGDLQRIIVDPLAEVMRLKGGTGTLADAATALQAPAAGGDADAKAKADTETMDAVVSAVRRLSSSLDGKSLRAVASMLIKEDCISIKLDGEGEAEKLTLQLMNHAMVSSGGGVGDLIELCVEVVAHNYVGFIANFSALRGRLKFMFQKNEN